MQPEQEVFVRNKQAFLDFLDQDEATSPYLDRIRLMLDRDEIRLPVALHDIRKYTAALAKGLFESPMEHLSAFDEALTEFIQSKGEFHQSISKDFHVGIEGDFGQHKVSPRQLSASFLGQLVALEGIVTKGSITRPKVMKSVHYCEATQQFTTRNYQDATHPSGIPSSGAYPTKDENQNALTTEFGMCKYRDFQLITLQEMPEVAPAGQLPRSIEVIVEDDLCNKVKPGDRVRIIGAYRAVGGKSAVGFGATFRTIVIANNVVHLRKDALTLKLNDQDITNIKEVAKEKKVFEKMASSMASSICGHQHIKKGLLLLLLGGAEKNLENGTHLRGDVNVLMVGDPSTAKSQLLRCVYSIAPLAINTTGRGSTGVGLTAAVTTDNETGDRRLEAGAMVLADRGIVCIDEFDKMSDTDRVAIHEVMEQQTVTVAKAGLHTTLNARCSVVAAANPVYGQYDRRKPAEMNVGLPDSLLSRFDLLYIVLDTMNPNLDREIASHVLSLYNTGIANREDTGDADDEQIDEDEPTPVYAKPLKGAFRRSGQQGKKSQEAQLYSIGFLRKYIHYAKSRIHPTLTDAAIENIKSTYVALRADKSPRNLPVSTRSLETLIRLSTAHAKCRLSPHVTGEDTKAAIEVMSFALTKDAAPISAKSGSKRRRRDSDISSTGGGSDTYDRHDDSDHEVPKPTPTRRPPHPRVQPPRAAASPEKPADEYEFTDQVDHHESRRLKRQKPEARTVLFRELFNAFRAQRPDPSFPVVDVITDINGRAAARNVPEFEQDEVAEILDQMKEADQLMVSEDTIYMV